MAETKSRLSLNILITDILKNDISNYFDKNHYDFIIYIDNNYTLSSLTSIIPIQLLSYFISIKNNINPDRPRNLAKKTVTVH